MKKLHENAIVIGYGCSVRAYYAADVERVLSDILIRLSFTPVEMTADDYEDLCLSIADEIQEHLGQSSVSRGTSVNWSTLLGVPKTKEIDDERFQVQ